MKPLHIASYNIHKGMSPLGRYVTVGDIGAALERLSPDLVFLQEVQGHHALRSLRHHNWPRLPQHHYLARHLEHKVAYGLNAVYDHGHHGNALLSRYALQHSYNLDISVNRFESRGLLHCELTPEGWSHPVAALCVHLNLLARDRRKQVKALLHYIASEIPADMPLILAGDFNDWRGEVSATLADHAGLSEVFQTLHGECAKSFPARMPVLQLDRIYVRGLAAQSASVLHGQPWSHLSDHLPLSVNLLLQ